MFESFDMLVKNTCHPKIMHYSKGSIYICLSNAVYLQVPHLTPFCDPKITFSTPSILSPKSNVVFKRSDLYACQMQWSCNPPPTSLWPKNKVHNSPRSYISLKNNALFKRFDLYACQNAMYLATPLFVTSK